MSEMKQQHPLLSKFNSSLTDTDRFTIRCDQTNTDRHLLSHSSSTLVGAFSVGFILLQLLCNCYFVIQAFCKCQFTANQSSYNTSCLKLNVFLHYVLSKCDPPCFYFPVAHVDMRKLSGQWWQLDGGRWPRGKMLLVLNYTLLAVLYCILFCIGYIVFHFQKVQMQEIERIYPPFT